MAGIITKEKGERGKGKIKGEKLNLRGSEQLFLKNRFLALSLPFFL
jgi:hypothetical protein